MSVETKLLELVNRITTSINIIQDSMGILNDLSTSDKSSLVNALVELKSLIDLHYTEQQAIINDSVTSSTKTWSSFMISYEINLAITELIDGAPGLLNTLQELAAALQNNPDFVNDLLTLIGTKEPAIITGNNSYFWAGDKQWKPVTKNTIGLDQVTNDTQLKAADLDIDTTLLANSDIKIPSQKAVKTYVDTHNWDGGNF